MLTSALKVEKTSPRTNCVSEGESDGVSRHSKDSHWSRLSESPTNKMVLPRKLDRKYKASNLHTKTPFFEATQLPTVTKQRRRREATPGQLAAGGPPSIPLVAGVRAAEPLTVEGGINGGARGVLVERVGVVGDPATREDVAGGLVAGEHRSPAWGVMGAVLVPQQQKRRVG